MASPPPAQRQRDVGRHRNAPRMRAPEPPASARAAAAAAAAKRPTLRVHSAGPSSSGRSGRRCLRGVLWSTGGRHCSFTVATPTMRLGAWRASSRSPAAGLPKSGHVCMVAAPVNANGDGLPCILLASPVRLHSTCSAARTPHSECASIRRRAVVMAALSEAFLSLDTTTPSPPRSRPSHPSGL